jgi:hypothetical protein
MSGEERQDAVEYDRQKAMFRDERKEMVRNAS